MPPKKRGRLAVSDEEDSDDEEDEKRKPRRPLKKNSGSRRNDEGNPSSDEEVEALIDNSQAGLSRKSKGKGKAKESSSRKSSERATSEGKGKQKETYDEDSIDGDEQPLEDEEDITGTRSEGTLHGSGSEEGLGRWTTQDQETWQSPSDGSEDEYEVDIVIRWRWHPRRHFAQYRVKWKDYPDIYNSWLPAENFNGDMCENFWKDIEFEGEGQRPVGWRDGTEEGKNVADDSEDTDVEKRNPDPARRAAARKRKRIDIRIDRVQMRYAYARLNRRKEAEEKEKQARLEKLAEERRRKRKEEESKKAEIKSTKKTISVGTKIGSTSKPAPVPSSSRVTATTTTTTRNEPASPTKDSNKERERIELLKAFATQSDAALKAERAKEKLGEVGVKKPSANLNSSNAIKTPTEEKPRQAPTEQKSTEQTQPQSAVRGETRPRGAFRGAHKAAPKIRKWDPMDMTVGNKPTSSTTNNAPKILPVARPSERVQPDQSTITSSISHPPRPPVKAEPSMTTMRPPSGPSPGPPPGPPPIAYRPPPLPPQMARGAMKTGHDPRRGPPPSNAIPQPNGSGHQSPYNVTNASPLHNAGSPMHPSTSAASPMHNAANAASPMHVQYSPREPNGIASPNIEQRASGTSDSSPPPLTPAEKDKALLAIKAWRISREMEKRIGNSYHFVPTVTDTTEYKDKKSDMDKVIRHTGGTRLTTIFQKNKDPKKTNNIVWIPNFGFSLGLLEREALTLPNFHFFYYGTAGVEEVWPPNEGKVVMYTFGALMLKLIEQCYEDKESCAWEMERGTSVQIHPWQKAILDQLIQANRMEDFLTRVVAVKDKVGDKDFAIVENGTKVLDDFEEVPSELTHGSASDMPDGGSMDLEEMTLIIDREVMKTLHKLQYEWRFQKRIFMLHMAKTRMEPRDVKTLFHIVETGR